jgi:hypothetical protein
MQAPCERCESVRGVRVIVLLLVLPLQILEVLMKSRTHKLSQEQLKRCLSLCELVVAV